MNKIRLTLLVNVCIALFLCGGCSSEAGTEAPSTKEIDSKLNGLEPAPTLTPDPKGVK